MPVIKITRDKSGAVTAISSQPRCGQEVVLGGRVVTFLGTSYCLSGIPTPKVVLAQDGDYWEPL